MLNKRVIITTILLYYNYYLRYLHKRKYENIVENDSVGQE